MHVAHRLVFMATGACAGLTYVSANGPSAWVCMTAICAPGSNTGGAGLHFTDCGGVGGASLLWASAVRGASRKPAAIATDDATTMIWRWWRMALSPMSGRVHRFGPVGPTLERE